MKRVSVPFFTALALAATVLITSCEWSSGSQENFSGSSGSFNVNISGLYRGTLQGRAVATTSNGNINSFTIQQSGNRLNVVDNQGSQYTGQTGAPLTADILNGGAVPTGATLATFQIAFSGKDNVAGRDIEFSGTITQVAVTDVNGETITTQRDLIDDRDISITTDPVIVTNIVNGVPIITTTTDTRTIDDTNTRNFGTTFQYQITEANTQLRLRGTWVEIGGVVSEVDAIASGAGGNIIVNQANNVAAGGGGGGGGGGGAAGP